MNFGCFRSLKKMLLLDCILSKIHIINILYFNLSSINLIVYLKKIFHFSLILIEYLNLIKNKQLLHINPLIQIAIKSIYFTNILKFY
mgnify:CR=1 FL=1